MKKKIFAMVLAVVMAMMLTMPAFAALNGYTGWCGRYENGVLVEQHWGRWQNDQFVYDVTGGYQWLLGFWKIGQSESNSTWRYFGTDGYVRRGWCSFDASGNQVGYATEYQRYFSPDDGRMYTGYQTISYGGNQIYNYYFDPTTGIMLRNAYAPNGKKANSDGVLNYTNVVVPGSTGTVSPTSDGCYCIQPSENCPFLGSQAAYGYGQYPYGQYPYGYNGYATSNTGWVETSTGWQYCLNGQMAAGWQTIGGQRYYFCTSRGKITPAEDCKMATGWKDIGNYRYYFEPTKGAYQGVMYHGGLATISGRQYYFADDGKLLKNTVTPEGYYINSSGYWDGKTVVSPYGPGYGTK